MKTWSGSSWGMRAVCAAAMGLAVVAATPGVGGALPPGIGASTYLNGVTHTSYQPGVNAITPANATSLTKAWTWQPGAPPTPTLGESVVSGPTAYDGVIYVGANNGTFYALSEYTGKIIWQRTIGYVKSVKGGCGARGFAATATVGINPTTQALQVYVAAPNGYLYDFDAANGDTMWHSVIGLPTPGVTNYYAWSAPSIANGHIYVGISSQCDMPLVQGGVLSFDQSTGVQQASYYNVPNGDIGGSVWSTPAVSANGTVFITTGNGPTSDPSLGTSISVIALNGTTLAPLSSWQVPSGDQAGLDSDFGASPTLFTAVLPGHTKATPLVGACNKNNTYYVFKQADVGAGPVWQRQMNKEGGSLCLGAAAFDGTGLYIPPTNTTYFTTPFSAPMDKVNPATGAIEWSTTLTGGYGSPSIDGAGVLAFPTYQTVAGSTNGCYLIDAATGQILTELSTNNAADYAPAVFNGQYLLLSTLDGIVAYRAP